MKMILKCLCATMLGWGVAHTNLFAQTDGQAMLDTALLDYNGSSTRHYTVAWVTTEANSFIKTLRKQGPSSWTSGQWGAHCTTWNNARASSTALDGYTSATAADYTGTNSPVILAWNGRDANSSLMPDGKYKFWVQYAEDQNVQGPYTTSGLLWTKGSLGATNTYPNQGANFTNLRITWTPASPPPVAPMISSVRAEGDNLIMSGNGPANGVYHVLTSTNIPPPAAQWTVIATNTFDAAGSFSYTNATEASLPQKFYELRLP